MDQYLTFAVLGFAIGAIYVGVALGLCSVYFASGVLNFSQAAIAMWGTYVFATLANTGELVFPVGSIHFVQGAVPVLLAALVGLVSAAILSAMIHLAVFRPLRRASSMSQLVASVAVLITVGGLVQVRFGTLGVQVPQLLPTTVINVAGVRMSVQNLILLALAVAACVAVALYFRWTTAGIATRASADNEDALGLMGYSPHRLDAAAWLIAATVSTTLMILAAPSTGLSVKAAYLVVPGLAILLVARMRSITTIAVAGIALGVIQAILTLTSSFEWWPEWGRSGLQDAVPFIIAIIVIYWLGDRIGARHTSAEGQLPKVTIPRRPVVTLVVLATLGLASLAITEGSVRFGVITTIIIAILVLSYTIITGYLGQISFAQMAFAGAAGFALSKVSVNWGIAFPVNVILAGLFATVIGLIIGVAALRFSGAQLAIATLAAAVAVQGFIFENSFFTGLEGNPVDPPSLFGYNLAIQDGEAISRMQFGVMVLAVLLLVTAATMRWMRGRTGRSWLAIRSNDRAAASVGVNVTTTKLTGFALSAFLAGVAGCLIALSQGQLSADSFVTEAGILILATAFLGGITSIGGAVVAGVLAPLGVVYVILNNSFSFGEWYPLLAGLGLIWTVISNPDGIAGKAAEQIRWVGNRLGRGRELSVDDTPASSQAANDSQDLERKALR